jgi:hypothetical protein
MVKAQEHLTGEVRPDATQTRRFGAQAPRRARIAGALHQHKMSFRECRKIASIYEKFSGFIRGIPA